MNRALAQTALPRRLLPSRASTTRVRLGLRLRDTMLAIVRPSSDTSNACHDVLYFDTAHLNYVNAYPYVSLRCMQ